MLDLVHRSAKPRGAPRTHTNVTNVPVVVTACVPVWVSLQERDEVFDSCSSLGGAQKS